MKRSKLNLSLKRRTKIIDDSMPKRKRGGEIKMKTIDLTESPSKRQTLITNFYISPKKSNPLVKVIDLVPEKSICSSVDVRASTSKQDNISAIGTNDECTDDSLSLYHHSSNSDVIILDDEEIPVNNLNRTETTLDLINQSDSVTNVTQVFQITPECKNVNLKLTSPVKYHQNGIVDNCLPKVNGSCVEMEKAAMSEKLNGVTSSPKVICVKPDEELLCDEMLFKLPNKKPTTPKKKQTTPKKSNKSVSPKNKNQPLSQIGSEGETVRFSPKIKRRPGKYFDGQTMPDELMKSPVSNTQSPKKSLTPRKRNLLKEFEKTTGQTMLHNFYHSEMQFTNESWEVFDNLMNDPEAMEKIRLDNTVKQPIVCPVVEEQSTVQQPSTFTSPSKVKSKNINSNYSQETFFHYLLNNPMINVAEQHHILDDDVFQEMLSLFRTLTPTCLQVYAKMYCRNPVWYRVESDLIKKYNDKFDDVKGVVATLIQHKFISNDLSNVELLDLLNLLLVQELRNVCNDFKVGKGVAMKKDNLVKILLNLGCSQGIIFSKVNMSDRIKDRVIKELGSCVRLTEVYKQMFNLLVILATYPYHMDEEKLRLSNLIKILNDVKMRRKTFPVYAFRPDVAFQDISQLNAYGEAITFVAEYSNFVESKNWEAASQKVIEAKERFSSFLGDQRNIELLDRLGGHLMKFTAGYQYAYCLSDGISVLKKDLKHADKCIEVIEELLSQRRYLQRKRGIWYDELALVYQSKKKDLVAACMTVKNGLEDTKVDKIRKLLLSQRAATLIKRKSSSISDGLRAELSAHMLQDPFQPRQHTITAKSHEGVAGRKQVFYKECNDAKEYSSVEEIVIDYYKNTAFPSYQYGLHDEGRSLMNFILACFYDVIYDHPEGESMFHCPLQTRPLDWGGPHFYTRRKQQIQAVLDRLRLGGVSEIMTTLQNIVSHSEDVDCVVNWEYIRADKLPKIKDLLECIGAEVFLNIAEHVIRDYKTYHSGFPDLIMWDPPTSKCLLVEVKGPNDKLSVTQTVWLENLSKFGADALVCHVENKSY